VVVGSGMVGFLRVWFGMVDVRLWALVVLADD
jgi:hypothetical protein